MGLFNVFHKQRGVMSLPQLSYNIAYFILPSYAFEDINKVIDMWTKTPTIGGPFFYNMACQMQELEPVDDDASKFRSHYGQLDASHKYYLLEYPVPPPVDMSNISPEELIDSPNPPVLAPHFSAIISNLEANDVTYFVLGQAPFGGGTTLRSVLYKGSDCIKNSNLGPGPLPEMNIFLDAIRKQKKGILKKIWECISLGNKKS